MNLEIKDPAGLLKTLFCVLIATELLMLAVYLATAISPEPSQLGVLFNLDDEANVPSWFSATQLFVIGAVLLLARSSPLRSHDHLTGLLGVLGAVFIFLSMDEAAGVHEKVTTVMTRFEWAPRFSGDHGIWMFVYVILAISMAATLYRSVVQVCRLYPRDVLGVAAGLGVLAGGAVGVEVIGYEWVGDAATVGIKATQVAVEEFLEMTGATLVLVAVVRFALRDRIPAKTTLVSRDVSPVRV
jgi:hypothetical protein